ncbi:MAG: TraB/GumN family protein [Luteimonas sp.]
MRKSASMLLVPFTALAIASSALAAGVAPPRPVDRVVAQSATVPVPLLWKASSGEKTVYLLGSFHLLKSADYPLSPDVENAFADAESVVFELPPEEMASPTLGLQMAQAALRVDGTQLDSELPPQTAQKLREWLAANANILPAAMASQLQLYEPWFVGLTITVIGMQQDGLDAKLGLDQHFSEEARKAGKPTAGFETGAQQIAFLDGMDKKEQLQFIEEALSESADGSGEIEKLHAAWRNGDAVALWDGMAADMHRQYPALYQRINVDRNDAWLPKIEQRLQSPGGDDTLVVVGALHLLGSDGVVEKLRAKGYAVERVCSSCKPESTQRAK